MIMKQLKQYIKALLIAASLGCGAAAVAMPAEAPAQSIAASQPQVRVLHGQIEITVPGEDDCQVTIYALTGQVIKSLNAAPGVTTVDLPKGYYIVKCDRISCRVVVK